MRYGLSSIRSLVLIDIITHTYIDTFPCRGYGLGNPDRERLCLGEVHM